jgi:hypothetical protein
MARRFEVGAGMAAVSGVVGAALTGGWVFEPVGPGVGVALAALGGAAAGAWAGRSTVDRLCHGLAGVVAAAGVVMATLLYFGDREPYITYEVLIPVLLGGLPGLGVLLVLHLLRGRPRARAAVGVLLLGAAGLTTAQLWPGVGAAPSEIDRAPSRPTLSPAPLAFEPDERHRLEEQFGDAGRAFVQQVDVVNSLVRVYSLGRVANEAWPAVEKLSAALEKLHAEMQRRVGQGADPKEFETFLGVEQVTLVFITRAGRLRTARPADSR